MAHRFIMEKPYKEKPSNNGSIIKPWPTWAKMVQVRSLLTSRPLLKMKLLKPYKGFTCIYYQHTKTQATLNHVLQATYLDRIRLTPSWVKINLYNPPFNLDLGIPHTPPYHLGVSPDFIGELLWACMPY